MRPHRKSPILGLVQGLIALSLTTSLQAASFVGLGHLTDPALGTKATAISNDGTVVVGFGETNTPGLSAAFRWTQTSGITPLNLPTGTLSSVARDVSADGSTVAGSWFPVGDPQEAFR